MAHAHDPRKMNLPAVYVAKTRETQRIRTLDTSPGTTKTDSPQKQQVVRMEKT